MRKMKLVMVGNGMAGVRTLEELLRIAPDLYDITVFGAEPHPNYNRILLSPVLAGEQTIDEIILNPLDWYAGHGITLHLGKKVVDVHRRRRIVTADGRHRGRIRPAAARDRLQPVRPAAARQGAGGVIAYRDIADTETMIETAKTHRHAVVIGGGLLGLEAANGLMRRGMAVTVVHIAPWLMERQLDETAGGMLQKSLEARGLRFLIGAETAALVGDDTGRVKAVRFKDGSEEPADLVVMAAGIRPNTALAEKIGLHCNRGIVVNDTMQTITDGRIYAVGECAAHRGIAYGLVAPLFEQAKVCATHLGEFGIGRYLGSQTSTKLKVTGIDLFSAGEFMGGGETEEIVLSDPYNSVYKKLVVKGDKLIGACLYGDTADGSWYFDLVREGRNIADIRDQLMFGQQHLGDTGHAGNSRAAAMADSAEVCGCNGVKKGTIVKAIREQGLFTARRGQEVHQGERLLRLLHRPRRADPDDDRRRRLHRGAEAEAGVRLHRRQPPAGARRDQRAASADDRRRLRAPQLAHAERLRQLPAGDQLLPHQHLAARGAGRSAVALHQRAGPRQHPEERHLLGRAADVGAARPARRSCGGSPTSSTSTGSPRSRSPAASASTCSG